MNEPNEPTKYEIVSVGLKRPTGISKSLVRSLGCERYFTSQYMQPEFRKFGEEHWLTRTGNEFHAWRAAYVSHLVDANVWNDPAFAEQYLQDNPVGTDAQKLIRVDAVKFRLNPATVYASELFLSVDRNFKPLEHILGHTPGKLSEHADFLLSGQIDLLLMDGAIATIVDPKSGFSTVGVTNHEPPFYSALVFAWFPHIQEVHWVWDFVRVSAVRRATYTRADLVWIEKEIRDFDAQKNRVIERFNAGEEMGENPVAGLCPYCIVAHCTMREKFRSGDLALGPLSSREDAIELFRRLIAAETFVDQARPLGRAWLDQEQGGRLEIGSDWEAVLKVSDTDKYPLAEALEALGLDIVSREGAHPLIQQMLREQRPRHTPLFDIPLASLTLGGLATFAKTRRSSKREDGSGGVSREGMKQALGAVAKRSASTRVVVHKTSSPDLTELLEGSIQRITGATKDESGH
jgi:hypothetical protein